MRSTRFPTRIMAAGLAVVLSLSSCDTGFESMNQNPTAATSIHPRYLLPTIQLTATGMGYDAWRGHLILSSAFVQHVSNTYYSGDKYTQPSDDWGSATWRVSYNGDGDTRQGAIKTAQHLIAANEDDPQMVNYVAAARILRVFVFQRVTDMYGDIPYFQGGRGALDDVVTPVYDPQSEIYADMLKELEEAAAQFDGSRPLLGDIMYGGDVERWRRFANSMMLRLGMRLVKVNQNMARDWVQKAIAGGVMQSNADLAYTPMASGPSTGPNGINSNGTTGYVFSQDSPMLTEAFVNWMKDRGDPRLGIYGAMYAGPAHTGAAIVSTEPQDQVGWPVGNDANSIRNYPGYNPDRPLTSHFSQPSPLIRNNDDPVFFQSYAEVEFMLAEAAIRGWHGGNAATHYENGVRAAMEQVALYDAEGRADISAADINAYLAANPYDAANGLEQINTQYWAATFLHGYEAWANYRRSGFPVLQEVNWPGNVTGGRIPRRVMYPTLESVLNEENYQAAVARQGPDLMTTRVWWDTP